MVKEKWAKIEQQGKWQSYYTIQHSTHRNEHHSKKALFYIENVYRLLFAAVAAGSLDYNLFTSSTTQIRIIFARIINTMRGFLLEAQIFRYSTFFCSVTAPSSASHFVKVFFYILLAVYISFEQKTYFRPVKLMCITLFGSTYARYTIFI